jgi:two-component system NtrC family sensor kinase
MTDVQAARPTMAPLAVVADVAVRLASAEDFVERVRDVLDLIRAQFGADESSLWLHGPTGLFCASCAGEPLSSAADVTSALERDGADGDGLGLRRLTVGARRIGALVLNGGSLRDADAQLLFSTLAHILAPALAHAEHLRQLESEVASRTEQIDTERRFTERIIDSLPLGLYVIDREYRVKAWNRNRETGLQGVSREQALGRTIFEILHRQPAEVLRKEFDDVFRSGRIQQFNLESQATGEARTYRITKIPMRLGDAGITHVISIGEDITDWSRAQDRFAQSEKLAAIGQLVAGVMHEVNNPLATIAACAESLSLRLDDLRADGCVVPPQASEFLRIIDNEVHRCKGIVDRLLDFSRPHAVKKELSDINAIIEQTLFLVKHHARFKKMKLHTMLDAGIDPVLANAEQLIQVFMALLINAVDAMSENGNITVRTRRGLTNQEAVIAEVIDEGHGITRTDLPKIFEPFYTTKPPGRGTGLGLSICYGIIAEHGGRIEVDSAIGAGSTFRVVFPTGSAE